MVNPIKALASSFLQAGPLASLAGLPGKIAGDVVGVASKLSPTVGAKLGSALESLTGAGESTKAQGIDY